MTTERPLRVASWPGYGATHNAFMRIFLDGLAGAGCTIDSLESVEAVAAAMRNDPPDILLLHWAERVFGESRSRLQVLAKMRRLLAAVSGRRPGTRVVWLVHNLAPHDARRFQRLVWPPYVARLSRAADAFLTLSPGTVATVRAALPGLAGKPGLGLWHPAYPDAALSASDRAAARAARGWDDGHRVIGYCGQIRPYKGVEDLIRAFRATTAPDLRLLLAGRPGSGGFGDWLGQMAAGDPRIALDLRDLPAEAFRTALGTCDVVAAPFRRYLHSGSIVHALSAHRPVLTPATPFAQSLAGQLGPDWVRCREAALTPALLEAQRRATGLPDLSAFAPDRVGAAAAGFLRGLA